MCSSMSSSSNERMRWRCVRTRNRTARWRRCSARVFARLRTRRRKSVDALKSAVRERARRDANRPPLLTRYVLSVLQKQSNEYNGTFRASILQYQPASVRLVKKLDHALHSSRRTVLLLRSAGHQHSRRPLLAA